MNVEVMKKMVDFSRLKCLIEILEKDWSQKYTSAECLNCKCRYFIMDLITKMVEECAKVAGELRYEKTKVFKINDDFMDDEEEQFPVKPLPEFENKTTINCSKCIHFLKESCVHIKELKTYIFHIKTELGWVPLFECEGFKEEEKWMN